MQQASRKHGHRLLSGRQPARVVEGQDLLKAGRQQCAGQLEGTLVVIAERVPEVETRTARWAAKAWPLTTMDTSQHRPSRRYLSRQPRTVCPKSPCATAATWQVRTSWPASDSQHHRGGPSGAHLLSWAQSLLYLMLM